MADKPQLPAGIQPLADFIMAEERHEMFLTTVSREYHQGRASAFAQIRRLLADKFNVSTDNSTETIEGLALKYLDQDGQSDLKDEAA